MGPFECILGSVVIQAIALRLSCLFWAQKVVSFGPKRALHFHTRALHLGIKPPCFRKKVPHLGKRALYLCLPVTLEEPPPLPQAIASLLFDHEPSALFVGRSWPRLVAGDSTGHVYMMQVCCSVL